MRPVNDPQKDKNSRHKGHPSIPDLATITVKQGRVMFRAAILGGKPGTNGKLPTELVTLTEPPLTLHLTDDELAAFRETPLLSNYPCHTQSVEHGVALTSKAVKRRRKEDSQLVAILQTSHSRTSNPGTRK